MDNTAIRISDLLASIDVAIETKAADEMILTPIILELDLKEGILITDALAKLKRLNLINPQLDILDTVLSALVDNLGKRGIHFKGVSV